MNEVDYIVVGAGSAGCVVAARLSEDPAATVALLEAGPDADSAMIRMPLAWMPVAADPRWGWNLMSEPDPHLGGRPQPLPRGKLLGGSSSINGTMYIRGHRADYDGWRDMGLPGWGYDDVLPYFRKSEANWRGASAIHGGDGPLSVTPMLPHPELTPAMFAAGEALGYGQEPDFAVPEPEGFGIPDCTIRKGHRDSTARAYIDPIRHRRNFTLVSDAPATRVLVEDDRAVGVEFHHHGQTRTLRARREVILCGGAFHSPQLLMLSGIGPAAHLKEHGIEVLRDLPGVGGNLQDHPIAVTIWAARQPNTFERELRLDRLAANVVRWALTGKGTPAQSPLTAQGFVRSGPGQDRPDLQFQVSHTSYMARTWFPGWRKGMGHQLTAGCVLLNPASRGQVTLGSSDPAAPPKILLNFLADPGDRDRLRAAMRLMRSFFATEPGAATVAAEIAPGAEAADDAALDAWMDQTIISGGHPACTCAMGTGPDAVLDAELRVRGIDALRVADASSMPQLIRGNTNAPTIMIGEKCADLVQLANR
ncbi:GMC family oxidoreductase [Tsuneonella sp. HG222]